MEKIAEFEIVSFDQFEKEYINCFGHNEGAFEAYQNIEIPKRATAGSAGYDIKTPFEIRLNPGKGKKIPTGLRVKMEEGWMLLILPKSGLGMKNRLGLDNTIGLIDQDYYYAENEGHIMVPIRNNYVTDGFKELLIPKGKAFVQAVFVPFGITKSDYSEGIRTGGFGSTNA